VSHHYYAEINLHIVWHTKESRPTLTAEVEKVAHAAIRKKASSYRGVIVRTIGGIDNHVHIALSVPPTVLVSELVGRMKGYSSHAVNQVFVRAAEKFEWQAGYGVVSFGTRNLEWIVSYVKNQKERHLQGQTFDRLEHGRGLVETMESVSEDDYIKGS